MNPAGFEPTIASLQGYRCPEWFRDAKFGIYVHWGAYSVAEWGEWYARQMYIEGDPVHQHHVETYGHPSQFGYKDLIPLWKGERFDPERLVGLFARAGARYLAPCAVHHDNFDLWNSKHHRWNAVEMGPKKDITGMWREAALRQGLRFGCTTHLARTFSWFNVNKGADSFGPYKGVPYDGADPAFQDYYLPHHEDIDRRHPHNPPPSWRRQWASRIKDLIDNYRLDFLYFDGAIPFQGDDGGRTGMGVLAHYYNQSMRWHEGRQECVMCIKKRTDHGLYVDGVATVDIERSRTGELMPEPWQTDSSIGPWGYDVRRAYRPVGEIIHELADIVSKNGNLLLNVRPRADGTLDERTESILAAIGRWLDVNGEAIYGTRPWVRYGEGPSTATEPGARLYTPEDIRFTAKGDALYAICLGWPWRDATIESLGTNAAPGVGRVAGVRMLGVDEKLDWSRDEGGLRISMPTRRPCEHAYAYKIAFERPR